MGDRRMVEQDSIALEGLPTDALKELAETQQALRASEERGRTQAAQLRALSDELSKIPNTVGIGITRCSRDLRYLRANETYATIAGLPLTEITGRSIVEVMGEAALTTVLPYIERVLAGERVEFETEILFRHSTEKSYFRVVYIPDRAPDGSIIGWIACISDITHSKQAERRLAERNTQLELASRMARVGSFVIDYTKGIINLSPGCATVLGLPENTVEIPCDESRKLVHPEDLAELLDAQRDHTFLKKEREFVVQFRIIRANDGEVRWVEVRSLVFYDQDDQPSRLIGVIIDLTERRLAEQTLTERNAQLALAGRAALVGSFAYDVDKGVMQISEGYAAIHGFQEGTAEIARTECLAGVHLEDLG
jgi:PAS domain S-box-containing protein